jgi:ABC-type multidrug transport system fused ATPase/permease subunit|tara:strand:+ start:119202 stop:119882 length:681 start_codon:yes stop_codon:yes gene_type:complete
MGLLIIIILAGVALYFLSKYVLVGLSPVLLNIVKIVFVALIAVTAYMNYDSIQSKIELEKEIKKRNKVVQERLENIRDAQIEYKKIKGEYAENFNKLLDFLKNDSIVLVYSEGEVPDSLIGQEARALELGIIIRDTTKVPVREELFKENFDKVVKDMNIVPFSDGVEFEIASGEIEKGKVMVKVFEVKTPYKNVYNGLDLKNEGVDLDAYIAVGSMEEPTTNGNWK